MSLLPTTRPASARTPNPVSPDAAGRARAPSGRGVVRFNPAFLGPDALRRGFVVRRDTLARVVQGLSSGHTPRVLLTGPRGAGKTTLALRAAQELAPSSGGGWVVAGLGEEIFTATTAAELWEELAQAAEAGSHPPRAAVLPARSPDEALPEPPDAPGAAARARLRALATAASRPGGNPGRVLAVIENLDTLLDAQLKGAEAARWQEEAAAAPWLAVLGTARRLPETRGPGWERIPLGPLTLAECRTLWAALSARLAGTAQRLEGHAIRPVQIFSGGVPRRLAAWAQAAAPTALHADALWGGLLALADAETPRVTAAAEALPPVERKVFAALAARWEPSTAREMGRATGLGTNRASALLHRLVGRGAVRRRAERGDRAGARYELADRGDNLVLALRRRGVAARRLRALVDFAAWFYWKAEGDAAGEEGAAVVARAREHGAAGRWREAVDALGMLLDEPRPGQALGAAGLEVLLDASARGAHEAALALAEAPPWTHALVPLRAALALRGGAHEEELTAAAEVRAVALDVLSAILSRREG